MLDKRIHANVFEEQSIYVICVCIPKIRSTTQMEHYYGNGIQIGQLE